MWEPRKSRLQGRSFLQTNSLSRRCFGEHLASTPNLGRAVGTNMRELINLRNRRKQAVRRQAAQKAEENRLAFGRSKAERISDRLRAEKARRELDGSRLEPGDAE
jgi:hypothetical protein